jgi:hypothetical protein
MSYRTSWYGERAHQAGRLVQDTHYYQADRAADCRLTLKTPAQGSRRIELKQ